MYNRPSIETIKTWKWVSQMPELMRELFLERVSTGTDIRFAKYAAEDQYNEIMSEHGGIN